jgi:LacI family transcriptional regulator
MRISADATLRVQRAVLELGYRPNAVALALRSDQTHTIAMVSDSIATNEYGGQMVRGAFEAAVQNQRLLIIAETSGDRSFENEIVQNLLDRRVDGFLYATETTGIVSVPDSISGMPCVLLNCIDERGRLPSFIPDERQAGQILAKELLNAGHRDGIFLVGEKVTGVFAAEERSDGLEEVLSDAGVELAGRVSCFWWPESAHEALTEFFKSQQGCKVLVCFNESIAMGAYQVLQENGMRVPEEISVVSFDGSLLAGWLRPGLTTVPKPHRELGVFAAKRLIDISGGRQSETAPLVTRVPMSLTRRTSLAKVGSRRPKPKKH